MSELSIKYMLHLASNSKEEPPDGMPPSMWCLLYCYLNFFLYPGDA